MCGIPLSRDVHFQVSHTLCTCMQDKKRLDLHVPHYTDQHCQFVTAEYMYMRVTTAQVYHVNVWNPLDWRERSSGSQTHLSN